MSGIYLRAGEAYVALHERPYDAESVLQELIERHPQMLAGDAAGHAPLLLVKREAGVTDREDAGARWSLDHLYLDGEGVPTLVEVKRSSDTRARREVVAQMLDYAANAASSFNVERLAAWVAEDAERRGVTSEDGLRETRGIDDAEEFWAKVATNLAAERLRLIFVADSIAPELRRIIEFLNGQMARTEVLAIEVKQYADASGSHQTIVPRVVGDTEQSRQTKGTNRQRRAVDRAGLLEALTGADPTDARAAAGLLDWAAVEPDIAVSWSKNTANIAVPGARGRRTIVRIWTERGIEVRLQTLRQAAGWDDRRCDELIERLEAAATLRFDGGRQWPKAPLGPLADPQARHAFVAALEPALADLRANAYATDSSPRASA